jgi:two-component system, LytTR family, sensor kinase
VGARVEGDRLTLWVRDDGPGLPEGWVFDSCDGFGLANTRSRLASLYGKRAHLTLAQAGATGVIATVVLPAGGRTAPRRSEGVCR